MNVSTRIRNKYARIERAILRLRSYAPEEVRPFYTEAADLMRRARRANHASRPRYEFQADYLLGRAGGPKLATIV